MDKKKRGGKMTRAEKLARELRPEPKKRFSIGGSGASLTKKQPLDIEMGVNYRLRLRVPPVRGTKQVDEKEFKTLLKAKKTKRLRIRIVDEIPMTKEEFKKKLEDGTFLTRRGRRTVIERRIAALEYFERVEENWWIQNQLGLLYYFDQRDERHAKRLYAHWFNEYAPKVARAINYLKDKGRTDEAKELEEHFLKLIDTNTPRRTALTGLRYKIRTLTLKGDVQGLRQLFEELQPLKKALEPS